MSTLAIVSAFSGLPDVRRGAGQHHGQALCLALFTLAISAGCKGFLSISDWLVSCRDELLELFKPATSRLPSYRTIRRVLLETDYEAYSACLAALFNLMYNHSENAIVEHNSIFWTLLVSTVLSLEQNNRHFLQSVRSTQTRKSISTTQLAPFRAD